jgi:predicted ribosomally synthesized peptide with nif11-like leader
MQMVDKGESEGVPSPNSLIRFTKALQESSDLQERVKAASNPQQIVDIAESIGFTVSLLELRTYSSGLTADYFPWAAMGNEWRRNFFKRQG